MRKAIEAFDREFAQWDVTLPARDIADREAGHLDRHGWSLDYSFGTDAFGEYLEYHGRRAVAGEPVIERHVRVYANGERNYIAAPAAADPASDELDVAPAGDASWSRRPTLPPWESMLSQATGEHRRPMSAATKKDPSRSTVRVAPPREARRDPLHERSLDRHHERPFRSARSSLWDRNRQTIMAFAIGIGGAIVIAGVVVVAVRAIRHRKSPSAAPVVAYTGALDPIVVFAPSVLAFPVDTAAARFTQPLVGGRRDPNKAEVVAPEHGMTPIIPSDPNKKNRVKPAATSRGGKFHVP